MSQTDNLRERVEALERHLRQVERRVRWWRGLACGVLVVGLVSLPLSSGTAQNEQITVTDAKGVKRRLEDLEYKLRHVSGAANEVAITGANLRIVGPGR